MPQIIPLPTPRESKYALKIICTAQYLKEVKTSNYQSYDYEYLTYLQPLQPAVITPVPEAPDIPDICSIVPLQTPAWRGGIVILSSWLLYEVSHETAAMCQSCLVLKHTGIIPHSKSKYLKLKNFRQCSV